MKRVAKIVAAIAVVVGVLALASYLTTYGIDEGGFPSGEFRIHVRDHEGRPVPGAVLRVYRGSTRELAANYPLDDHVTGNELMSDERGQITTIRRKGGIQFSCRNWRLFWVIPIGKTEGPQYDCEITAAGFQPLGFPVRRLFESPYLYYADFPKTNAVVDGQEVELKIYEHKFSLER